MHEESRGTLIRDMQGLLGAGRDDMDTLSLTPRRTSNLLLVMVRAGSLQLVYPQDGWFDWARVARFWRCGLRQKLWPRVESWGKMLAHRVNLGSDANRAAMRVDEFFAAVYQMSGPFALDFTRQGWGPLRGGGAA